MQSKNQQSKFGLNVSMCFNHVDKVNVKFFGFPHLLLASVKPSKQDAFDLLFLPGKEAELAQVIHLLTTFVNQHLNFLSIKISDLATEMHDGVYVIIMIGCIGDFFVPLCRYKIKPENVEDKVALTSSIVSH